MQSWARQSTLPSRESRSFASRSTPGPACALAPPLTRPNAAPPGTPTICPAVLLRQWAARLGWRWRAQLVVCGRFRTQQVSHKIIPAASHHIRLAAEAVPAIRKQQQIEILIVFDQLVHHQQRVVRGHVVIGRAVRQQQLALEVLGEVLIRLAVVIVTATFLLCE